MDCGGSISAIMVPWRKMRKLFSETAEETPRKERRIVIRRSTRLLHGCISGSALGSIKQCRIRDITSLGARVDFLNYKTKPSIAGSRLTLYVASEKKEIDCEVLWWSSESIGVRFIGGYREPIRRYSG